MTHMTKQDILLEVRAPAYPSIVKVCIQGFAKDIQSILSCSWHESESMQNIRVRGCPIVNAEPNLYLRHTNLIISLMFPF